VARQIDELMASLKLKEEELSSVLEQNKALADEINNFKNGTIQSEILPDLFELQTNLINSTNVLLTFIDKNYRYIIVNDPWCEFLNIKRENAIGRTISELWGEEDFMQKIKPHFDSALAGNPVSYETWLKNFKGENFYCTISFRPHYRNKSIEGVLVTSLDMTDRYKAEEMYRNLIESATDGIVIIKDGLLEYINHVMVEITGYTKEEAIGKPFTFFICETDRDKVLDFYNKRMSGQDVPAEYEFYAQLKNGCKLPLEVTTTIFDYFENKAELVFLRDISARKASEEILRANENRNRTLLNAIPDMMFRIKRDGTFIDYKATAGAQLYIPPEAFLEKKVTEILPPDIADLCFSEMNKAFETGELRTFQYSLIIEDAPGYYEARVSTDAETDEAVFIVRDISENELAKKEIALKNDLLRLTSEMAKVGGWEFYTDTLEGSWTDEVARIHDLEPSTFSSVALGLSFYTPQSKAIIERCIKEAIEHAKPYDLELEMISAKGIKKWVRTMAMPIVENGKVVKMQGIFQDITQRKETALELENERQMLRTLIETMPDIVLLKDVNGVYMFCNNEYEKFYGKTEKELLGKTDYDFVPAEIADKFRADEKEVLKGGKSVYSTEEVVYASNKHKAILAIIKTPLTDADGNTLGTLAIGRDVTEQVEYEIKLKNEHDYVLSILESMSDAFIALDKNWRFTYMNAYAGRIYNRDPKKMIGTHIWTEFPEGVEQPFYYAYIKAMKENISITLEEYYPPYRKWFENYINPTKDGLLIFFRDITERKLSEKALQESEARYRLLFEQNPAPMLIYEKTTLLILAVNEAFLNHYGYSGKEMTAMHLADLYPDNEKESIVKLAKEIRGYRNVGQWHHRKKDGSLTTISVRSNDILYEGHISRVAVITDITDKVIAEEKMKTLNVELEKRVTERTAELENANKDLEAFAYSVSHDLRSPLRHIDGFARLLQKNIPAENEESGRFIGKINNSTTKMALMIDSLLTFSRLGRKPLQKTMVNLNELVQNVIKHFEPDITGRDIEWKIGTLPVLSADRDLLQLVLENLISNSIKFTSRKDKAIIEIYEYCGPENRNGFYIKDNGAGFDMAYSDKLFGVFQRLHTTGEFEGTGIGLANIYRIIQKHGGTIRAEGIINNGATFYITL
jgi:PAS domain S-box-containing protein